jgi:hypothetical protein
MHALGAVMESDDAGRVQFAFSITVVGPANTDAVSSWLRFSKMSQVRTWCWICYPVKQRP